MKLDTSIRYKVANHIFELRSSHPGILLKMLPSYNAFFIEQEDTSSPLFTLHIVGQLKRLGNPIHHFDWDGSACTIYQDTQKNYYFELQPLGTHDVYYMQSDEQFKTIKVALYGADQHDAFVLNNFLMMSYAFASAPHNTLMIHASVIRNDDKGYLFLGLSGTGKSTHSQLWLEHIKGSELLNDDNPILRIENQEIRVYGSPWSGKTPCYRNTFAVVGGFVRLYQAPHNKIQLLTPLKGFAQILSSCSLMKWDKTILDGITATLSSLSMQAPTYQLDCLPDKAAAQLCYNTLTLKNHAY
jgi:hypothetical protein